MFWEVIVRMDRFGVSIIGSMTAFEPPVAVQLRARFPLSKKSQSNRGAVSVLRSALEVFCTGSIYNSALPTASAFSKSRPVTRQVILIESAVRRLLAARGSFARDFGAERLTTERPSAFISFKRLRSPCA